MKRCIYVQKKVVKTVLLFTVGVMALQPLTTVYAIDKNLIEKGITMYDTSSTICGETLSPAAPVVPASTVDTNTVSGWVDAYGQLAYNTGIKYGIPYVAILAQAALESGWGKSSLTTRANNFFGIKAGSSWTGETVSLVTDEQNADGSVYSETAGFRKYPNPQAGFDGYGQFITENSRYKPALAFPNDPAKYIQAIKDAGYATDTAYVSKNVGLQKQIEDYIVNNTKLPASNAVAAVPTVSEEDQESPVPEESLTAVVNKKHPNNPIDYKPANLVNIAGDSTGDQLHSEAAAALTKLVAAAAKDSVTLKPSSAFRSYERQKELYDEDVKTKGKEMADKYTARPGYSEHQTGLALDFSPIEASFETTASYKWLTKNAHKYGFILRYPKGKTSITGYDFEPWHWRFIGETEAKDMFIKGTKTLEEHFGVTGGLYADTKAAQTQPTTATADENASLCNQESTSSLSLGPGSGDFVDSGQVSGVENVLHNAEISNRLFGDQYENQKKCAAIVSRVWRGTNDGWGYHTDPKTKITNDYAVTLWYEVANSVGHADRNAKVGSILLYSSGTGRAGHTVIYLGNNKILNDGYIRDASYVEKGGWDLQYLGWVDPNDIGWTSVQANDSTIRDAVTGLFR